MGGKSASLLTKKQRSRIRDGFAELDEEKTRRDQQRIRDRLESGVLDFRLLADYPDRQLEMAFEDVPEDELRGALADASLVTERLRELHGLDREDVVVRARDRADALADDGDDLASLRRLDLRTAAEIRRETEREVRDQLGADVWEKRANGALKLAASAFVPVVGIWLVEWLLPEQVLSDGGLIPVFFLLFAAVMFLALAAAFFVKAAQALKYNVVPGVRAVRRDPTAVVRDAVGWLRRPGQTLREFWKEL